MGRAKVLSSIRRANAISDAIRDELTKRLTTAQIRPWDSSLIETDLFAHKLEGIVSRSRRGRDMLAQRAEFPRKVADALAGRLKRKPEELARRDLLRYQSDDLARETGVSVDEIRRLKLAAIGLPLRRRGAERGGPGGRRRKQ